MHGRDQEQEGEGGLDDFAAERGAQGRWGWSGMQLSTQRGQGVAELSASRNFPLKSSIALNVLFTDDGARLTVDSRKERPVHATTVTEDFPSRSSFRSSRSAPEGLVRLI